MYSTLKLAIPAGLIAMAGLNAGPAAAADAAHF